MTRRDVPALLAHLASRASEAVAERGSMRPLPDDCKGLPLRGFVMDRRRLVGGVDLPRLFA